MKRNRYTTTLSLTSLCLLLLLLLFPSLVRADEVLDWNTILQRALVVSNTPLPGQPRVAAIVHVSIFDAVNGIGRRKFTPIHVTDRAPRGASRRAAAVQAAYTALVALFPAQRDALAQELERSLAAIAGDEENEESESSPGAFAEDNEKEKDDEHENSKSIARGRLWGEQVANEILAWRSTDGFNTQPPPFLGSDEPGVWRPTPPGFLPGLFPQLAHTLPWVIPSPSSFRPGGPPPLASAAYAADVNEVKAIGELGSNVRTADQTEAALFWAATVVTFWNRAAATAVHQRHRSLLKNARLFALLNVAMADAAISCWDAKYLYVFWRPITAIRLASTDGNPDTAEQANWTPLLVTPPFPEYTSGHGTLSGAAHAVLTIYFGDDMPVEGTSEGLPGVVRSWPNFTAAADEANEARIWAGIHFRTAVRDARHAGDAIGTFVMANAAQRIRGRGDD